MQEALQKIVESKVVTIRSRTNSGLIFSIPLSLPQGERGVLVSLESEYAPREYARMCKEISGGSRDIGYASNPYGSVCSDGGRDPHRGVSSNFSKTTISYTSDSYLYNLLLLNILKNGSIASIADYIILSSCRPGTIGEGILLLWKAMEGEKPKIICLAGLEEEISDSLDGDVISFEHLSHPVRVKDVKRDIRQTAKNDYELIELISRKFEEKIAIVVIVATIDDAVRVKALSGGRYGIINEGGWADTWRGVTWDVTETLRKLGAVTEGGTSSKSLLPFSRPSSPLSGKAFPVENVRSPMSTFRPSSPPSGKDLPPSSPLSPSFHSTLRERRGNVILVPEGLKRMVLFDCPVVIDFLESERLDTSCSGGYKLRKVKSGESVLSANSDLTGSTRRGIVYRVETYASKGTNITGCSRLPERYRLGLLAAGVYSNEGKHERDVRIFEKMNLATSVTQPVFPEKGLSPSSMDPSTASSGEGMMSSSIERVTYGESLPIPSVFSISPSLKNPSNIFRLTDAGIFASLVPLGLYPARFLHAWLVMNAEDVKVEGRVPPLDILGSAIVERNLTGDVIRPPSVHRPGGIKYTLVEREDEKAEFSAFSGCIVAAMIDTCETLYLYPQPYSTDRSGDYATDILFHRRKYFLPLRGIGGTDVETLMNIWRMCVTLTDGKFVLNEKWCTANYISSRRMREIICSLESVLSALSSLGLNLRRENATFNKEVRQGILYTLRSVYSRRVVRRNIIHQERLTPTSKLYTTYDRTYEGFDDTTSTSKWQIDMLQSNCDMSIELPLSITNIASRCNKNGLGFINIVI